MNILITGGAGYIGSAAADILLQNGHRVTVYDSLVTGHRAAVPEAASFIEADLADRSALESTLGSEPFDAVMHFAAFIEAGESMQNPGKFFHNNVVLSLGLMEACHTAGVPRFVLSSSAAVADRNPAVTASVTLQTHVQRIAHTGAALNKPQLALVRSVRSSPRSLVAQLQHHVVHES